MSFLQRSHAVAPAGYKRTWVAIAAVCVHVSIGQLYAFSVFNRPLMQVIGVGAPTPADWTHTEIAWIFGLANALAGLTAAVIGTWIDRLGPRLLLFAAALCFGGGFWISALGISLHELVLLYLGYGVIGGIGIGIGYITSVATLLKWFPDRPGLASGIVIMGFGAGAIIGAPLAVELMAAFRSPTSVGVAQTMLVMGALYLVVMLAGALIARVPATAAPEAAQAGALPEAKPAIARGVPLSTAVRTRTFYLLWLILFLNVTAGVAVISQAAAMIQELFPLRATVGMATLFVTLLSVGNMVGRIGWSTVSDAIGRRMTFAVFFLLGATLYFAVPYTGGNIWLYMICYMVIISMYGGGFATIPAYVKDVFGLRHFSGIYGPVLTAWSAAGLVGPALLSYLNAWQIAQGIPTEQAYGNTMHLMAALLLIGFVCNALIRTPEPRVARMCAAAD